jgi:hypothetical protein
MDSKIGLLFLILLLQISCSEIADKPVVTAENNIPLIKVMPDNVLDRSKIEPRRDEKMVIYWSVLDRIYDDDDYGKKLGTMDFKDLVYRIDSVAPEGIEQLENNQDIPQSLINNFKTVNQKNEKVLEQGYPGTRAIIEYSGSRELEKFYKEAKRKYPDTQAVVGFSNIGIDDTYTTTIVYVEYYRPDKGLVKFYFLMKMELLMEKIQGDSFSGVESFKMIQVN